MSIYELLPSMRKKKTRVRPKTEMQASDNDMYNDTLVLFVRNLPLNVIKDRESINQRDGTAESAESMKQIKSVVPRAKLNTN